MEFIEGATCAFICLSNYVQCRAQSFYDPQGWHHLTENVVSPWTKWLLWVKSLVLCGSVYAADEFPTYQESGPLEISGFRQSILEESANGLCWFCWKIIWFRLDRAFFKTKCALEALPQRLRLEGGLGLFLWDKDRGDFGRNDSMCIMTLIWVKTDSASTSGR